MFRSIASAPGRLATIAGVIALASAAASAPQALADHESPDRGRDELRIAAEFGAPVHTGRAHGRGHWGHGGGSGYHYRQSEFERGRAAGQSAGWREGYTDGVYGHGLDSHCRVDLRHTSHAFERGFRAGYGLGYTQGHRAGHLRREYDQRHRRGHHSRGGSWHFRW